LPFLPLQQQSATRNNASTTRTCSATAAQLSRRPVLSPLAPALLGRPPEGVRLHLVAPKRRSPEYLEKFIQSEIEKWAALIRAANIKAA
jgi:hypothetical protein